MPRIFLIRHAEAEDVSPRGGDAARRLTVRGRERAAAAAQGMQNLVDGLTAIAHSPLRRALETAQIMSGYFPDASLVSLQSLLPGTDPDELLKWFAGRSAEVAVVGHEPMLSHWIGYAVSGQSRQIVEMKKSAVCTVEMPHAPKPGSGRILWLMTWRQLAAQK